MVEFKLDFEAVINSPKLTQWERSFAESIFEYSKTKPITEKQQKVWSRILDKLNRKDKL